MCIVKRLWLTGKVLGPSTLAATRWLSNSVHSLSLCLFQPGYILLSHWPKQLYSLPNKSITDTKEHPTSRDIYVILLLGYHHRKWDRKFEGDRHSGQAAAQQCFSDMTGPLHMHRITVAVITCTRPAQEQANSMPACVGRELVKLHHYLRDIDDWYQGL